MFAITNSNIHGRGIIATRDIQNDTYVGTAIMGRNVITPWLGRWINHSTTPNGKLVNTEEEEYVLVTTEDVKSGQELTLDYTKLPNYLLRANKPGDDWKK